MVEIQNGDGWVAWESVWVVWCMGEWVIVCSVQWASGYLHIELVIVMSVWIRICDYWHSLSCSIPRELNVTPQGPTRHSLLSFKHFLAQQDDNIDETDAIASYNEYKNNFKRKQMEEFFEKHKKEDWWVVTLYHI